MDIIEQAEKAFIEVRDELHNSGDMVAYRLSWKRPRKFYREHSKEEALRVLRELAEGYK